MPAINGNKLRVADLGCSSGPNTLSVVANVLDSVEEGCRRLGRPLPEVQMFLNDLPGNDFNTIFISLQGFYEKCEAVRGAEGLCRCFVAGTAGSFHGRLFPNRSIHLFHSSSSFHWLSQAYIKEENFDSFNLPFYLSLALEVEQEIHKQGSFSVECLKVFKAGVKLLPEHAKLNTGQIIANITQAMVEPFLVRHFGGDIIEVVFSKYMKLAEEDVSLTEVKLTNIVVSLVRNP